MAIALAAIPTREQRLDAGGGPGDRRVGITALVYGGVALIVKADDVGLALAGNGSPDVFGRVGRLLGVGWCARCRDS